MQHSQNGTNRGSEKNSTDIHLRLETFWCILALTIIYRVLADLSIARANRDAGYSEERLDMDEQMEISPHFSSSLIDVSDASIAAEGMSIPVAADRMYQFAALTAGLFLLFTLL
jgi:hypothetical protein